MGLLSTPFRVAQFAVGAALVGGDTALKAGRNVTGAVLGAALAPVPQAAELVQDAAGMVVEALSGPPVRRTSTRGERRWIEVRGLAGPHGERIAAEVAIFLTETDGVRDAVVNQATARVVVTVGEHGPSARALARIVAEAEEHAAGERQRELPTTLPGDDAALAGRLLAASVSTVGLGIGTAGAALRMMGLTRAVAAPFTLAGSSPTVRRRIQAHLGPYGSELAMALAAGVTGTVTLSATGLANEAATRWMLAAETLTARRGWQLAEEQLARQALAAPDTHPRVPRNAADLARGVGDRYADRAAAVGLGAAAALGVFTRDSDLAGAAAVTAAALPVRSTRESFAISLGRGLIGRHDALILRPAVLRRLDVIDTLLIDPRVLHTDELTVTQITGVDPADRGPAWAAARAALQEGALSPGWHPLADIPGAGDTGQALVSPLRDPLAAALVTEARRVGLRVVALADDGLRSLGQGFDELFAHTGSADAALAAALGELHDAERQVAVLTGSAEVAALPSAITVGLWRDGSTPPWGADLLLPDLAGVWRFVRALPAAARAAERGVQAAASGSVLGALMLIPDVPGSGPGSVNLSALAALWTGYRLGAKVFDGPLPHPESGHDWHALPVDEVTRLLPRPDRTDEAADGDDGTVLAGALTPLRPLTAAVGAVWGWAGDMFEAIREDLDDPITPILATGAVATALLGSPLDAAMVGGVLLLNTSISAQQSVHAERVLGELLAVQEPLARRLRGAVGEPDFEMVPAGRLALGDLILVVSGEVVPADGRILAAESAEADESALTGESLPVPKDLDPTPGAPLAERSGMLFAGTTLVTGRATAVVTAVGGSTQMNRASAMQARKARKVGLQAQLTRITNQALPWSLAGGGAVGLLSLLRGNPLRTSAASGVAIAVAAVPEGLPLVVTLAQLAAARRLTENEVLIRNPRAIEAFARLDVVCFDKTGTLSENRLQVTALRGVNGVDQADLLSAALDTVLPRKGQRIDHATDEAIRLKATELGLDITGVDVHLPFQSDRQYAAAINGNRLSVKGAPEAIVGALYGGDPLSPLIAEMTAAGLRVIAVADRYLTDEQVAAAEADPVVFAELCAAELSPIGAIGIADTPRPSARPLLAELQSRGIGVRLITGDHPVTARVIAGDLGLTVSDTEIITGTEWEVLTTDGRIEAVRRCQVFARMAPEHKVQVVQALEAADLVTAMVGDGANDAAAIRAATVGVGLVASGSDTARTAADVLLLDGQIGALVDAIDEGHQLWRRVQAAVSMLVGHNLGEVAFALITSLLTGQPALSARQILLINMLTDALPAAALAVSPQLGNGLADFDEDALWRAIYVHGASTTLGATTAWAMGRMTGRPERAATVGLAGLVLTQLFSIVSESHGPLVVATSAGTFVVMAGMISTPGISQLFGCTPLGPIGWGQAALAAGAATAFAKVAPDLVEKAGQWAGQKLASGAETVLKSADTAVPGDRERAERRREAEEQADESLGAQVAEEAVLDLVADLIEDL